MENTLMNLWFIPDFYNNAWSELDLNDLENKYKLREGNLVTIGEFTIQNIIDNNISHYHVTWLNRLKIFNDKWMLIKGLYTIQDFDTRKRGDLITEEDILKFMTIREDNDSFEGVKIIKTDYENETIYRLNGSVYDIKFCKDLTDGIRTLNIVRGIKRVHVIIDNTNKVVFKKTRYDSITIESKDDFETILQYRDNTISCVITSNLESIYLNVYLDFELYYEAGIEIFGNEGDLTIINADYWNKKTKSPYYNPGWILTGYLEFKDDNITWYPLDNNFKDNPEVLDYYRDGWDLKSSNEELLSLKKKFILDSESKIKDKLKSLNIKFDEIIEF